MAKRGASAARGLIRSSVDPHPPATAPDSDPQRVRIDAGADLRAARRGAGAASSAGPGARQLPFTFDHERETGSIVRIEGVRQKWTPRPVHVDVRRIDFFRQEAFAAATPALASAFYLESVPYLWRRGVVSPLAPGDDDPDD